MKFFLDENFPRPAVALLQTGGHGAVHAMDVFSPGAADERLFAHAQNEGAIFLSTDRDFFHTVPLAFAQHCGAMVITLRKPNRSDLLRRLSDALTTLGDRNLDNTVWLITDTRIYSRQKP
jgi:predicted nuclease of predicted toxin-antitoxin system